MPPAAHPIQYFRGMTRNEFLRRFPRASESAIRQNCSDGLPHDAERKSDSRNEPMGPPAREGKDAAKCAVRVTSFRTRCADERNLWDKYFIDALVKAGILFDDSPQWCRVEVTQELVPTNSECRTEIVIERIC